MSNSLWPHGLQPARLLHPWDFLGKFCTVISCKIPLTSVFYSCLIICGRFFRFLGTVVSYQLSAGTGGLWQVIALEDKTLAHFSDIMWTYLGGSWPWARCSSTSWCHRGMHWRSVPIVLLSWTPRGRWTQSLALLLLGRAAGRGEQASVHGASGRHFPPLLFGS